MTMKQEKKRIYLRAALALAALLVVLLALDNLSFVPSMLLTVLRKGAIYALVAVSMNLLNGFTGLITCSPASLGRAVMISLSVSNNYSRELLLLSESEFITARPILAGLHVTWRGFNYCRFTAGSWRQPPVHRWHPCAAR